MSGQSEREARGLCCMVVFYCYLLLLGQCHFFLLLLAKLVCIFFAWQLVTLSGVGWSGVRLLLMVVGGTGAVAHGVASYHNFLWV